MKRKALFILPHSYHAHLPHFTSRFEAFQDQVESHVLLTGDTALDGSRYPWGALYVHEPCPGYTIWHKLKHSLALVRRGVAIARNEGIEFVIAYDPLKLGLIASCIKLVTGCRLIVEVNGHYKDAKAEVLSGSPVSSMKKLRYNLCSSIVINYANMLKFLNFEQVGEWSGLINRNPYVLFHDFVPVAYFSKMDSNSKTILSVGFPFQLKGVDLLLQAFTRIGPSHPAARLIIMGHGREPELSRWRAMIEAVPGAELRKPIFYDQMPALLQECSIFAMPSRSEGMGRVFIEAMACGKPVVGTRVGGIPNVIHDGVNGFLVEPEDVDTLADRLRQLLDDGCLRQRMGQSGAHMARTVFSEAQYGKHVVAMLEAVDGRLDKHKRIVFNGFEAEHI